MTNAHRLSVYARQNGQTEPKLTPRQRRRYIKKEHRQQAAHLRSNA